MLSSLTLLGHGRHEALARLTLDVGGTFYLP
jgi:hypothetical protein